MSRFISHARPLGLASVGLLSLALAGCPDDTTNEDAGVDAAGADVPGLDAPGADVPGLDAPAMTDGGGPVACTLTGYPALDAPNWAMGLNQPLYLTGAPGTDDLFVVQRQGTIVVLDPSGTNVGTFLTLAVRSADSEQGLLGLAFHPEYATNGLFYVYYTENGTEDQVVAVGTRASARAANPTVEVILRMSDFEWNHNGGCMQFGPDGELYIGTGDGGGGGDPMDNGQDNTQLLGKLLRIHVDATTGTSYTIPASNPFAATDGPEADEIYATGLRNPWRFSFDRAGGDLYIGDVGQNVWEEIDVVNAGMGAGVNFGWSECEGLARFGASGDCAIDQHDPVLVARHGSDPVLGSGIASITGGYVYRGTAIPALVGAYLFGDYGNGAVGGFRYCDGAMTEYQEIDDLSGLCNGLASFGQDNAGELYMVCINNGSIRRIVSP